MTGIKGLALLAVKFLWREMPGLLGSYKVLDSTGANPGHRHHSVIGVFEMEAQPALDIVGAAPKTDEANLVFERFLQGCI